MNEDRWNEENAADGGPQYEDLYPYDQIEADRQENAQRGKRKPR